MVFDNYAQRIPSEQKPTQGKRKTQDFDDTPNQKVLKKQIKPDTLGARTSGPYTINQVHSNGTITISLREGVTKQINISRVIPFQEKF